VRTLTLPSSPERRADADSRIVTRQTLLAEGRQFASKLRAVFGATSSPATATPANANQLVLMASPPSNNVSATLLVIASPAPAAPQPTRVAGPLIATLMSAFPNSRRIIRGCIASGCFKLSRRKAEALLS